MKYIVFEKTGSGATQFFPVIIPDHVTHSMVKLFDCTPVSAGHFHIKGKEVIISKEPSTSLLLYPHQRDALLLESVLDNSGIYAFMRFD